MKTDKLSKTQLTAIRNHVFRYGIAEYQTIEETVDNLLSEIDLESVNWTDIESNTHNDANLNHIALLFEDGSIKMYHDWVDDKKPVSYFVLPLPSNLLTP